MDPLNFSSSLNADNLLVKAFPTAPADIDQPKLLRRQSKDRSGERCIAARRHLERQQRAGRATHDVMAFELNRRLDSRLT